MKNIILSLIFVIAFPSFIHSQNKDEIFYPSNKEWIEIPGDLIYDNIFLPVEEDTINVVILQPESKVKATVIYYRGRGGNISNWIEFVKPLLDGGFRVCMMDYRGSGKSSGHASHANVAYDAQVFFDYILQIDNIKDTKIIIYGASLGSQVATLIAKNNNDKISAVVLDGAMTSFTDIALATSPVEEHDNILKYVISPYSAKEDVKMLDGIKVLFIHSEEDYIPIAGAKKMYNSTNTDKIFWQYTGNHIEAPLKYPQTFYKYMQLLLE